MYFYYLIASEGDATGLAVGVGSVLAVFAVVIVVVIVIVAVVVR